MMRGATARVALEAMRGARTVSQLATGYGCTSADDPPVEESVAIQPEWRRVRFQSFGLLSLNGYA